MKEMWNQKYAQEEFVYGTTPNHFFKKQLDLLAKGDILLPAEGEGRNAVYAATTNWNVTAFDISEQGRKKALMLAQKHNVYIDYKLGPLEAQNFMPNSFNVIALCYSHLPPKLRETYHKAYVNLLAPNGTLILEGFNQNLLKYQQGNPSIGGPKKFDLLWNKDILINDFKGLTIEYLEEEVIELNEGIGHMGKAPVIRLVGVKK